MEEYRNVKSKSERVHEYCKSMQFKRVAFTGHRPNKLYGYNMDSREYMRLEDIIKEIIELLIDFGGAEEFYTGGALGFDTIVERILIDLKKDKYYSSRPIKDYMCIPFKNQFKKWNYEQVSIWFNMLDKCHEVITVDTIDGYKCDAVAVGEYHPLKMTYRNMYMVDNCDVLVACWDETMKGGTYDCIQYAKSKGKEIIYINPQTLRIKGAMWR